MSETEYFALSMLCIGEQLPYSALAAMLEHTGHAPTRDDLFALADKGFVSLQGDVDPTIAITDEGRRAYVLLLALDGRIARGALSGFAPHEIAEFAEYLQRVIANTSSGSPDVWAFPRATSDGAATASSS